MNDAGASEPGRALAVRSARELSDSPSKRRSVRYGAGKQWQPPEGLAPEDVLAVIDAAATERDRLLLRVLWATGARISEALAVRPMDVRRDSLVLPNLKNPSRTFKRVFLPAGQMDLPGALLLWAREHELLNDEPIFFSRKRTAGGARRSISRQQAWEIVRAASELANVRVLALRASQYGVAGEPAPVHPHRSATRACGRSSVRPGACPSRRSRPAGAGCRWPTSASATRRSGQRWSSFLTEPMLPLREPPVWTARSRAADLVPAEFERVLGLGLGRAILFLREHEAAPHRAAILRACSQHTAYDPQVEGSRAAYLFEVLQATGDPTAYLDEILTALLAVTNYWDADQLFDLARCFAQAGHARAREAMYEKFLRNDVEEPFVGAAALVRLDGLRGLLVVAEHVGRTVRADPAAWIDQSLLAVANEVCGKEQVRETLEQARAASPEIAAFIDALEANRAERAEAVRHRLDLTGASYERVREVIASQPSRQLGLVVLQRWGRAASDEELARAAADLLAESDEDRLISYLRIFGKRRFPLDPAPLLPLVPHANTRLVAAAFTALSHLSDARVRQVALDLLQDEQVTGWARGRAADLLVANYLPGDAERLAGWLTRSRDRDE